MDIRNVTILCTNCKRTRSVNIPIGLHGHHTDRGKTFRLRQKVRLTQCHYGHRENRKIPDWSVRGQKNRGEIGFGNVRKFCAGYCLYLFVWRRSEMQDCSVVNKVICFLCAIRQMPAERTVPEETEGFPEES